MMVVLRRAGVVLIVLALALGLGGALAGAKKHKKRGFGTGVTLSHPSDREFTGRVSSKLKGCRAQRLVTLYYTDPSTFQTQPLSVQRTTKKGNYRVDLTQSAYGGSYRAQVPKVSKGRGRLCRAGRSNVLNVGVVPPAP
jgi:hypothetical protein